MRRHYRAVILVRYREGDLSSRKTLRIKAHLETCDRCSAISTELVEVSAVLASVEFAPMPAHIANRLSVALAAESGTRVEMTAKTAAAEPVHTPGRPDLPERATRRGWRLRMPEMSSPMLLRGAAAAGALAIVAGGGYLLANNGAQPSSSSGGQTHHPPSAGRVAGSHAFSGVPVTYNTFNGRNATTTAMVSDTNYQPGTLRSQIRQHLPPSFTANGAQPELNSRPSTSPQATANAGTAPRSSLLKDLSVPHLAGCLSKIAAGAVIALADIARYQGKPAIIIAVKIAKNPRLLNVFVVSRACSASAADIITRVQVPVP